MARPPKPTALKLIQGNAGKRALNKQEPDPEYLQDLTAPGWLPPAAAKVWDEIAPNLSRAKLLTHVDVDTLAMGCVALAQYRLAVSQAGGNLIKGKVVLDKETGEPVTGDDGKPLVAGEYINPWTMVQSMSFKQAMAVLERFGMNPAARTRIAVQPQGDLFDDQKGKASGGGGYFT